MTNMPFTGKKALQILLVEDNEADLKIAARAFASSVPPSRLWTARSGQDALDFIYGRGAHAGRPEGERPDLLLLDLNMPGIDGFGVIEMLKKDPAMREIPIVIMTTSRHENDILRAYQSGVASYIPKAVDYEDFRRSVNALCEYWTHVSLLPGRTE
ncbi:MAG: response regulator [Candidatus Omnitrophica bacterium]|jgi:two-component system response regulator|nr:response regulator [Candidatus Omnitrophota bacterium]